MKTSTISVVLATLVTLATLLFSHASIAHYDEHPRISVNAYVLATRSGLARSYFNYSYDIRRTKKLVKPYRIQQSRAKRSLHHHNHHYSDCPYTEHDHHH